MKAVETNPDPEAKARLIETIVAEHGSLEAFAQSMREYKERYRRMIDEGPSLLEQYPDQWIGIAPDEKLVVGSSLEEVLALLDQVGAKRGESIVEFLNTKPRNLKL